MATRDVVIYAGSVEPIPSVALRAGQSVPHEVALVPFTDRLTVAPDPDSELWAAAPLSAAGFARGYYCIYTLQRDGELSPVDHAGHVEIR